MIELRFLLAVELGSARPVFTADINGVSTDCLLDTGAAIPIFCGGQAVFNSWSLKFEDVKYIKSIDIGGFGKFPETVSLYDIPEFCLSDGSKSVCYKHLKIAVMYKPNVPGDLVLSASMFDKVKYTLDYTLQEPELQIQYDRDWLGVGFHAQNRGYYTFTSIDIDNGDSEAHFGKSIHQIKDLKTLNAFSEDN